MEEGSNSELDTIKKDIQELKSDRDLASSITLIEAMDKLATQMSRLVNLFEKANEEMYEEYTKGFHNDAKKLDMVVKQNEKIAKGVLAVADLIHGKQPQTQKPGAYPLEQDPHQTHTEHTSRHKMLRSFE